MNITKSNAHLETQIHIFFYSADAFSYAGLDKLEIKSLGFQNSPLTDRPTINSGYFSDSSVDSDEEVFRNDEFTYTNNNDTDLFFD